MRKRMDSNLMSFINGFHILRFDFIMRYALSSACVQKILASQKLGIDVEGRLQAVLVKKLSQTDILRHAVVVAERHCFHFAGKHNGISFEIFILNLYDIWNYKQKIAIIQYVVQM